MTVSELRIELEAHIDAIEALTFKHLKDTKFNRVSSPYWELRAVVSQMRQSSQKISTSDMKTREMKNVTPKPNE